MYMGVKWVDCRLVLGLWAVCIDVIVVFSGMVMTCECGLRRGDWVSGW